VEFFVIAVSSADDLTTLSVVKIIWRNDDFVVNNKVKKL
jgi:hypothetical protein